MTHIGTDTSALFHTPRTAPASIGDASGVGGPSLRAEAPRPTPGPFAGFASLPPPTAPPVAYDARTVQAMASFEAEVQQMCASCERWAGAQDQINAALLHEGRHAAEAGFDPALAHIRDGGLHYFMRLRLEDDQKGAAALRRLARGAARSQERHLEEQRAHQEAALATARKMQPVMAKAQIVAMAAHTCAMAAGCVAGALIAAGAAGPGAALAASGLTLGCAFALVVGGLSMFAPGLCVGGPGTALGRAAAMLDVAALSGLLMMTAAQAHPWVAPMLVASRLVDYAAGATMKVLQGRYEADMREAEALAHMARVMGTVHERGYAASMDGVTRINQAHARAMSIIQAMLKSGAQVSDLQIRNLRK